VGGFRLARLTPGLVAGARVVLLQLPRSLDALDEIAGLIAEHADPEVVVVAGGRVKHMTTAMNDVLERHLADVQARLARQKSRVLVASAPRSADRRPAPRWPERREHPDLGLTVLAHGGAFAGAGIDIGTRALLAHLDAVPADATSAVDLGCGTGVLAVLLARGRPGLTVTATDESAAAVASARATVAANGLADRVVVLRADAAGPVPDASADVVLLNPPFHVGAAVHAGIAHALFADAARVLRPGGELWAVWNSHLRYRPTLERVVGPTRQVSRDPKFTVTVSTRAPAGEGAQACALERRVAPVSSALDARAEDPEPSDLSDASCRPEPAEPRGEQSRREHPGHGLRRQQPHQHEQLHLRRLGRARPAEQQPRRTPRAA
jgi:16S rRNA (guanine1207-N2)-methyltransferase